MGKTPLNFLLFVLISPYLSSLNYLPLWRRLCNKKASYVYFFPFLCFANTRKCFKEKLSSERKSLKGKSSTFLPSEKISVNEWAKRLKCTHKKMMMIMLIKNEESDEHTGIVIWMLLHVCMRGENKRYVRRRQRYFILRLQVCIYLLDMILMLTRLKMKTIMDECVCCVSGRLMI